MSPSLTQQLTRHTDRLAELDFLLAQPDLMADMGQGCGWSGPLVLQGLAARPARLHKNPHDQKDSLPTARV